MWKGPSESRHDMTDIIFMLYPLNLSVSFDYCY
jgi:hypothetical protein